MSDSILNRVQPGATFGEMLPVGVLFLILFCLVWTALVRMEQFPKNARIVLAVCVTLLALFGISEDQLQWITRHYAAMAMALLVSLAAAIRRHG